MSNIPHKKQRRIFTSSEWRDSSSQFKVREGLAFIFKIQYDMIFKSLRDDHMFEKTPLNNNK